MLRRQGIGFENKQVHDFTTSTLRTKQKGATGSGEERACFKNLLLQGTVDWSSCGHLNGQRRCWRSTKQNNKNACFSRETARYLLLLMPRHLHRIYEYFLSLLNAPLPPHPLYLFHGNLQQTEQGWRSRWNGAAEALWILSGSPSRVFFKPWRGNEVLRRRAVNWNFKMVLIVCTFLHSCLSLPVLPDSPFISITPAIMTLKREERVRGSTLVHSSLTLKGQNRSITDLHYSVQKYTLGSALCCLIIREEFVFLTIFLQSHSKCCLLICLK